MWVHFCRLEAASAAPVSLELGQLCLARRPTAVHDHLFRRLRTRMDIRYTLSLEDHLAWYDHYLTAYAGVRLGSSLPLVGGVLDRFRRW